MDANTYYLNEYQRKEDAFDYLCDANADEIARRAQDMFNEDPYATEEDWEKYLSRAENEVVSEIRGG